MLPEPYGTVAITGYSGYLGAHLVRHLEESGYVIRRLGRSIGEDVTAFQLGEYVSPSVLDNCRFLVHCAYDMSLRHAKDIKRVNIGGTRLLLDAAVHAGVERVVVLSSMSAYSGTRQLYGLAKLRIEELATEVGAISVRPGLVYGGRTGGMAAQLQRLGRLPIVPVFGDTCRQFTLHVNDFCIAIEKILVSQSTPLGPVGLANATSVRFEDLVRGLRHAEGRGTSFVNISPRLAFSLLYLAETVGVRLPFRADSLIGLTEPASVVPNLSFVAGLGLRLRRFGAPA